MLSVTDHQMAEYGDQTTSYAQYGSNTTEHLLADSGAPSWREMSDRCGIIMDGPVNPPWPSMLSGRQNFTEPTIPTPLPRFPSATSETLNLERNVGKRKKPAAEPPTQRKLAPKGFKAASDTGTSPSLSSTSGPKRPRRDSNTTRQSGSFSYSEIQTHNVTGTTTNTTPYPSANQAQNSGLLRACGPHTPPDLFQAYSALCVVVEFCKQQPPEYLEHGEAVVLGMLKERLKARRCATQHGKGEQG
jgi:hypothetical protein